MKKLKKKYIIIAAIAHNNVIGVNTDREFKLPWDIPEDLKFFRDNSLHRTVIMGHNTFLALNKKPLLNRYNIVLSTKLTNLGASNLCIVPSLDKAVSQAEKHESDTVVVMGGSSVYAQMLPIVSEMLLTIIDADYEGNVFFPVFNKLEWNQEVLQQGQHNGVKYEFIRYTKNQDSPLV